MATTHQSAQSAEDAMILKQSQVQIAQVNYTNSKVQNEQKLAAQYLKEFIDMTQKIAAEEAQQKAAEEKQRETQMLMRGIGIALAVVACLFAQPEVAAVIVSVTLLSNIPAGPVDKKTGMRPTVMDLIVNETAKGIQATCGGTKAEDQLLATILIAVVFAAASGGAAAYAAGGSGLAFAGTFGISSMTVLGSDGFTDKLTNDIESSKECMEGLTSFFDWISGKKLDQAQVKSILGFVVVVGFMIANISVAISSIAYLRGAAEEVARPTTIQWLLKGGGKLIGAIRSASASAAALRAASAGASDAGAVAPGVAGALAGTSGSSEAVASEAAALADAETELMEVAELADSPAPAREGEDAVVAADEGSQAAKSSSEVMQAALKQAMQKIMSGLRMCYEGASSAGSGLVARASALLRPITEAPVTSFMILMGVTYFVGSVVQIVGDIITAKYAFDQSEALLTQGKYGRQNNLLKFNMQFMATIGDGDSKALASEWQVDSALQSSISEFSSDRAAIGDLLLS